MIMYTTKRLEQMQKKVVFLRDRDMSGCLFGFATATNECACTGENYGDYSVLIFENGVVEYKKYLCFEIPIKVRKCIISTLYTNRIETVLNRYSSEISSFHDTFNGLCDDGETEMFYFGGKWIQTDNIFASADFSTEDEQKYKSVPDSNYDKQCLESIMMEKVILRVFDEICSALDGSDVDISLNGVHIGLPAYIRSIKNRIRVR